MHRTGQPPSVVPLDRKRTALANHFGCALDRKRTASGQPLRLSSDQSKPTPCGCASGQDASRWPTPFGCALDQKCTALANPLRLCPRSKVHRVRPTQRPYSHLANHLGCACQPFRLCSPAIAAVLTGYYSCAPIILDRCGTFADDDRDLSLDNPRPSIRVYAVAPLWRSAAIRALPYSRTSNGPTMSVSRAHRSSS